MICLAWVSIVPGRGCAALGAEQREVIECWICAAGVVIWLSFCPKKLGLMDREPTSWKVYSMTHKVNPSYEGSTINEWIDDAVKDFATKYQTQIDELTSKDVEITHDVDEDVFHALSTSMAKRSDRKPNYGNLPAKYRRRDNTNVSDQSTLYIAHMEQKLVATEAKVELLQSNYEKLFRLVENQWGGQAGKPLQDQDHASDE